MAEKARRLKAALIVLLLLLPVALTLLPNIISPARATQIFFDDFEDGDYTSDPTWTCQENGVGADCSIEDDPQYVKGTYSVRFTMRGTFTSAYLTTAFAGVGPPWSIAFQFKYFSLANQNVTPLSEAAGTEGHLALTPAGNLSFGGVDTGFQLVSDTWYFIEYFANSSSYSLYTDGDHIHTLGGESPSSFSGLRIGHIGGSPKSGNFTAWFDDVRVTDEYQGPSYPVDPEPATIAGLECSEWVFAERFYDYSITMDNASFVDVVQIRFQEGAGNWITAYYDYNVSSGPKRYGLSAGQEYAELGQVTSSLNAGNLTVTFPIWVELDALDATDIDLYQRVNTTDALDSGWVVAQSDYFNLYVLGGVVETASSGTAGRLDGGDIFEIFAQNASWVAVNSTWKNLQHFSSQFSIIIENDPTPGIFSGFRLENFSSPQAGNGFPNDWFLETGIYVCDPRTDSFYRAWYGNTTFFDGNLGADDLWTTLNTTWFNRETEIKEDLWSLAPEAQNNTNHGRVFLDLWFNQANSSRMTGGRLTPFFYGVNKDVEWGFFGNWHIEYANVTTADYFDELEDSTGSVISARELSLMKVYMNLSIPNTQDIEDYRVWLDNFETLEFRTTKGAMMGVPTPTFKTPRIPDTPGFDLWGMLGDLFGPVLNTIWDALYSVASGIWDWLVEQIPFLGDVYGILVAAFDTMYEFFDFVISNLLNLLTVLGDLLYLVSYPIRIIGDMWARLVELWEELGLDVSASAAIAIVLLVFGGWVFVAITDGDWDSLIDMANRGWNIGNAVIVWAFKLVRFLVDIGLKIAGVIGNYIPFT